MVPKLLLRLLLVLLLATSVELVCEGAPPSTAPPNNEFSFTPVVVVVSF